MEPFPIAKLYWLRYWKVVTGSNPIGAYTNTVSCSEKITLDLDQDKKKIVKGNIVGLIISLQK